MKRKYVNIVNAHYILILKEFTINAILEVGDWTYYRVGFYL